ncbi:MAG: ABC transporter permease [Turicibacter sp.]
MDFLNRAWKQNIRKPMKTLMIFLVMFVISNLMVTGIFILKGTESATNATLSKITPVVYYTQDWQRYTRAQELGFINYETDPMPAISIEDALKISESENVKTFDISTSGYMMSRTLKAYKDPNNEFNNNVNLGSEGTSNETYFEPVTFNIIGTSSIEFKVASGTIELIEGRGVTTDDITTEKQVVVIEERLAKVNELAVGDTISLDANVVWDQAQASQSSTTEKEFEVIGIYRNLSAESANDPWLNERMASQIYMPYNVTHKLGYESYETSLKQGIEEGWYTQEEADQYLEDYKNMGAQTIGYLLNDPLQVREFINDNERLLSSEYHALKVGNSTYDSIAKSVDSMTQTSNLIIYIVFGAGILILSLITSLTLKSREYEIGVLLSLGESKVKVIGQLMSELLIIAILAFSLSIVSGNYIAKYYGEEMLKAQLEGTMSDSNNSSIYIPEQGYGSEENPLQYTDFVTNFNIELEPMVYVELMIYGLLVVGISTFIPIIFITRYNPKTILTIR